MRVSPALEKKILSKTTDRMKKAWAYVEFAHFAVIGSRDPVAKLSHFYRQSCRFHVSVLNHGSFEILRHYQGAKVFCEGPALASGDAMVDSAGF